MRNTFRQATYAIVCASFIAGGGFNPGSSEAADPGTDYRRSEDGRPGDRRWWRPGRTDGLTRLAVRAESDSRNLAEIAADQRTRDKRVEQDTVERLRRLASSASDFRYAVRQASERSGRARDSYEAMRRDYDYARPSMRELQTTRSTQAAMGRLDNTMRELEEYYPDGRREPPRSSRIEPLARELDELTDDVYDEAKDEAEDSLFWFFGGDKSSGVSRLRDLSRSAEKFNDQIQQYHRSDLSQVLNDFGEVVDDYNRAGNRVGVFSHNVQDGFYEIGDLLRDMEEELREPIERRRYTYTRPAGRSDSYSDGSSRRREGGQSYQKFQKKAPKQK